VRAFERSVMNKKIAVIVILCAFAAGLTLHNLSFAESPKKTGDLYKELELFSDAVSIIRSDYVEKVDSKNLIYGALKGMLSSLDPYSQFMDPDTYNEMKVETEGRFGGIGIEITIRDNLLTIIAPLDDTPADKVGLKAGDKIVKIDGEITRDLTLIDAVKRLRGKPGTDVDVMVLREEEKKLLDFTITRSIIRIKSIKKSEIIEPGIGYIRLSEFQEKTGMDMEKSLVELEGKGMKGLILDLRNNPGGLLNAAVDVSGEFLEKGKTIVSTKGRLEDQSLLFKSKNKGKHLDYPIVVLINGGSASASEIVTGAIQDNKRGIVMGTKSFGKGSVQTVMPLPDGSALRLTTSKYFTPAGRSIHGKGIMPDIVVEYKEAPKKEEKDKGNQADIFNQLSKKDKGVKKGKVEVKEKEKKQYDNQVQSAADVLKGIIIIYNKN